MNYKSRLTQIIIVLISVVILSTIGYVAIEKWSWFESFYMTIITISTVGFQYVKPISRGGEIFTVFVILGGTGTMLYAATSIIGYVLEGHLGNVLGRRRMREEINKLNDHVILCGYGKVGQEVARVFRNDHINFVIIEIDRVTAEKATGDGFNCVVGDATNDEVLKESGIGRARALVAALSNDANNLFVTLSAKNLNPKVFVVARLYGDEAEEKFKRAGADRTMSPYKIGGRRLALMTVRPTVVDFLDRALGADDRGVILEDIEVCSNSLLAGITWKEGITKSGGLRILGLLKKGQTLITNVDPETIIEVGDELIVAGTQAQLESFENSCGPLNLDEQLK